MCTENEKKASKYFLLNDKFQKMNDKLTQVETSKKVYSEKFKELEKENKEMGKVLFEAKEKIETLTKENIDLRQQRVEKEKYLLERVKRAELNIGRVRNENECEVNLDDSKGKKSAFEKNTHTENDKEWNCYRIERKKEIKY